MKKIIFITFLLLSLMCITASATTYPVGGVIHWKGYDWTLKSGYTGPSYNYWNNTGVNCWIDDDNKLHMMIRNNTETGNWECTQLNNQYSWTYGTFTWETESQIDEFDPRTVVGLYTYKDDNHEIDIEYSNWVDEPNKTQYSVQPNTITGNKITYPLNISGNKVTHIMEWKPTYIRFKTLEENGSVISQWNYTNISGIPTDAENLRMNFWLINGLPPNNNSNHELVLTNFTVQEYTNNQTYYISPTGNDSNNGTKPDYPFKTFSYAISQLVSGNTLLVEDGTYPDQITVNKSNITIQAYNGTPTIPIGNSTRCIYGTEVSNVIIDGLNCTGANVTDTCNIYFRFCDNITVKNCRSVDGYDGLRYYVCNDSIIDNNYITNMNQHGIHNFCQNSGHTARNVTISRNNVSNCGHNMIDFHSNCTDSRITGNTVFFTDEWIAAGGVFGNQGMAVHNGMCDRLLVDNNTVRHTFMPFAINNLNDSIIRDNYFEGGLMDGSRDSQINIAGVESDVKVPVFGVFNLTFKNNTLYNINDSILFYVDNTDNFRFQDILFENNTFSNNYANAYQHKEFYLGQGAQAHNVYEGRISNLVFRDNKFNNFTINWMSNTISPDAIKFENTSAISIHTNNGIPFTQNKKTVSLYINSSTTDVWYGDPVTYLIAGFIGTPRTGTAPLNVSYTDLTEGLS